MEKTAEGRTLTEREQEQGTGTDIQVLALILLDVIQAEQNNEKFTS